MKYVCFRCGAEAIPTTLVCFEHVEAGDVEAYAAEYAVASILYYEHDVSMMDDARFDGLAWWLHHNRAWNHVPWLEEGMLSAGSGFDTSGFPPELRELAERMLG